MKPTRFRRFAVAAWLFQALIVASGAAVRLTESGLGCSDWPTCNEGRWVPEVGFHDWIEFGNRLISLAVTATTVALLVGAYRRRPRRDDLVTLAWWLVGGTVAQIVLGGITVLLDLNPIVVSIHFLVSMGLLWVAGLSWWRADPTAQPERPALPRQPGVLARALVPLASIVLITGTVVTGSGPHSGDVQARRLGFELVSVARVHAISVWILVASLVAVAVALHRSDLIPSIRLNSARRLSRMALVAALAQGAIGYTQFALGVPAALVEAHVIGAVVVWTLITVLYFTLFDQQGPNSSTSTTDGVLSRAGAVAD